MCFKAQMKTLAIATCVLALLCGASAFPNIAPIALKCGNGISCAHSQTCMSNATGAGLVVRISTTPALLHGMRDAEHDYGSLGLLTATCMPSVS